MRACPGCGLSGAGRPASWEARFSYWEGSQRRQRSLYAPTQAEAAALLRRELIRVSQGYAPGHLRQTVGEYLAEWMSMKEKALRPSTWATYRGYVDGVIIPDLGRVRLAELGPRHVDGWMEGKLRAGLAPQTVVHLRAILRAALNDARRRGLVDRNAAALAPPPRVEKRTEAALTAQEANGVLEAVAGSDIEAAVAIALLAGLRMGEVLGLAWRDVDLEASTLRVRQALQRVAGVTSLGPPKSSASRRMVPLTRRLSVVLSRHQALEVGKREQLELPPATGDALVFTNRAGDPVDPTWLNHAFHARLEAAGQPRRRFHDLRHGCGALLLASGADLKVVSAILGHSSIRLTADVYTAVVDQLRADAAVNLDRLISAGAGRETAHLTPITPTGKARAEP